MALSDMKLCSRYTYEEVTSAPQSYDTWHTFKVPGGP